MAKYKASPQYVVGTIKFNAFGLYETDVAEEITALDALVPTWVRRIDEKTKEPEEKAEAPEKPAPKQRTKASGK